MIFERFTESAKRALFFARFETSEFGADAIEAEHLLLGILREGREVLPFLAPASVERLRQQIADRTPPREKTPTAIEVPFTGDTKRAIETAVHEADALGHPQIGTPHLFLALVVIQAPGLSELLEAEGVHADTLREAIKSSAPGN